MNLSVIAHTVFVSLDIPEDVKLLHFAILYDILTQWLMARVYTLYELIVTK